MSIRRSGAWSIVLCGSPALTDGAGRGDRARGHGMPAVVWWYLLMVCAVVTIQWPLGVYCMRYLPRVFSRRHFHKVCKNWYLSVVSLGTWWRLFCPRDCLVLFLFLKDQGHGTKSCVFQIWLWLLRNSNRLNGRWYVYFSVGVISRPLWMNEQRFVQINYLSFETLPSNTSLGRRMHLPRRKV